MQFYPRYIEPVLKAVLADTPVVCLLGPRQVGKTTLVQRLKPKKAYISFDDENLVMAANNDPIGFVQGLPDPVILDEIQRVPALLTAIKSVVDSQHKPGRFFADRFCKPVVAAQSSGITGWANGSCIVGSIVRNGEARR